MVKAEWKSGNLNSSLLFQLFSNSVFDVLDPGVGRPRELSFNSVSNFGPEGTEGSQTKPLLRMKVLIPRFCRADLG